MPMYESKIIKLPNGDSIALYPIGSLAEALGRTPTAIRKWEIGGIIPKTIFRDNNNRRLYSKEMIDKIVECAERAKIKQGGSIANTSFSTWCFKEIEILNHKYLKKK